MCVCTVCGVFLVLARKFFFFTAASAQAEYQYGSHTENTCVCVCVQVLCVWTASMSTVMVSSGYIQCIWQEWDGIETESPLSLHHIYGSYDKSSLFRKSAALMQVILCEPDSVKHNKSNQNWAKHMNTNLWCPAAEGDEEEWPLFYPSFLLASHLNIVLIWTRSWLWASSCHISSVWDVVRAVNQSLLWRNKWTDLMDESLPRDVFVLSNQHEHQHNSHIKSKHTV